MVDGAMCSRGTAVGTTDSRKDDCEVAFLEARSNFVKVKAIFSRAFVDLGSAA